MTSGAIRDPDLRGDAMPKQSGSGERAESLGVRRSVELPDADIDAAGDLAPAGGSGAAEDSDASADEAEDEVAASSSGESEATAPDDSSAKVDAAEAQTVAVAAEPD